MGHMIRQCLQKSADIMPYLLVCLGHILSVSCWTDECHMHLEMCVLFIASFVTVAFCINTFSTQQDREGITKLRKIYIGLTLV